MNNVLLSALGAIALGVAANEVGDWAGGLAVPIVRVAARLWSRSEEQASTYMEEWAAHIEARPGNVLKLLTALGLLCASVGRRAAAHRPTRESFAGYLPALVTRFLRFHDLVSEKFSLVECVATVVVLTEVAASVIYPLNPVVALQTMAGGYALLLLLGLIDGASSILDSFRTREKQPQYAARADFDGVEDLLFSRLRLASVHLEHQDHGSPLARPYVTATHASRADTSEEVRGAMVRPYVYHATLVRR